MIIKVTKYKKSFQLQLSYSKIYSVLQLEPHHNIYNIQDIDNNIICNNYYPDYYHYDDSSDEESNSLKDDD